MTLIYQNLSLYHLVIFFVFQDLIFWIQNQNQNGKGFTTDIRLLNQRFRERRTHLTHTIKTVRHSRSIPQTDKTSDSIEFISLVIDDVFFMNYINNRFVEEVLFMNSTTFYNYEHLPKTIPRGIKIRFKIHSRNSFLVSKLLRRDERLYTLHVITEYCKDFHLHLRLLSLRTWT